MTVDTLLAYRKAHEIFCRYLGEFDPFYDEDAFMAACVKAVDDKFGSENDPYRKAFHDEVLRRIHTLLDDYHHGTFPQVLF